ncbi:prepilin peptidase [Proteiniclasticum sp. BAD-10]|uniref:Prepilin peptidase n=1 Tax=Proteiniclasticum sediminis TaxID=2804028 RepID=A0A941HPE8_9CLOT|nr:A24 family peptidase [Proteiniclasticum sediminis]MBR0575264.1 prepilin peptidase [Proteiniclasticum sediminis]
MNVIALVILLVVCVYFDLKYRKIPNKITIPILLFGVIYWTVVNKLDGLTFGLVGVLVGFLVFLAPYIAGGMGAGDVKLMMAVGALLGWKLTILSALFAAIAGGLIALGYIILTKSGKDARVGLFQIIIVPILKFLYRFTGVRKFLTWQTKYDNAKEGTTKKYIPYAIPITIGTLLAVSGLFQGIINF